MRERTAARPARVRPRSYALPIAVGLTACAALLVWWFWPSGPARTPEAKTPVSEPTTTAVDPVEPPATVATPSPAPATAVNGPTVIGTSVKGRPISAERFGSGPRRVLIVGGVHGDEYGIDVATALAGQLRADPDLVPAGVEIHIIECLNPDGRADGIRGNANKVDLNLNMPAANWKHDLSPETSAHKHGLDGGSGPGSEPESKALIAYLEKRFALVISLHSAGGVVDWNGEGEAIARRMAGIAGLKAEHLPVQPYATGTMGQYIPEKWGIPVITIELASRRLDTRLREALLAGAEGH
jgi:protein MpaA